MLHTRYAARLLGRGWRSAGVRAGAAEGEGAETRRVREYNNLLDKYKDKIRFNSALEEDKLRLGYVRSHAILCAQEKRDRARDLELRSISPLPVSLKYVVSEDRLLRPGFENAQPEEDDLPFHLPYAETIKVERKPIRKEQEFNRSDIDRWMTNYDYFDDSKLAKLSTKTDDDSDDESVNLEWTKRYGTADPNEKVSNVPCGGCGALLHCTDTSIPGYIPSEIFKRRTVAELKAIECQRCHFLKQYNIALNVSVHPEEYEQLLNQIGNRQALVILMVDLLDFPCSIWPGIVDIIGTKRPIVIVGNKVDLLPGDSQGYLGRIKDSLMGEIKKTRLGEANIKNISLISAKTGYGVEDLISNLFKIWLYRGDVFLIGCTNVGKSSLFNALLQSDYCKVHAADLVQRATVSCWPGTTLNLLKFPINRPSGWKIYHRTQRLKSDSLLHKSEQLLRQHQLEGEKHKLPTLMGHIGRSFVDIDKAEPSNDPFSYGISGLTKFGPNLGINERDEIYANSKWFYDTPGVVHPEQILSLLTAEELLLALPKTLICPRTYYLHPGATIFIAGLARVDLVECDYPARLTVFCSNRLPVTITKIEDADEVYEKFLGTELLGVPKGNEERMQQWPGLKKYSEPIKLMGEGNKLCCGDIVLSSAAWVSVTAPEGILCTLSAWTPEARGVNVRTPSMLKHAVMLKGKRVRDTPAYRIGTIYMEKEKMPKRKK